MTNLQQLKEEADKFTFYANEIKTLITKAYEEGKEDLLIKISKIPKIEMTFSDIKEALNL